MALVVAPEPPVADWIGALDEQIARSATFFDSRPVVVDLSAVTDLEEVRAAMRLLEARDLRIIGVEGADPAWSDDPTWGRTPLLAAGRPDRDIAVPDDPRAPAPPEPTSLVIEGPVRSGQSIVFDRGDVTIVGAVASGAEVVAGGSIHVYGALRGRAIAGLLGSAARIFCRRMEAELLAIDGVYKTADAIDDDLRGRPVQAWLEGDSVRLASIG
jgi:septum site-determining protein MinC